jgi:hypothetical protein
MKAEENRLSTTSDMEYRLLLFNRLIDSNYNRVIVLQARGTNGPGEA